MSKEYKHGPACKGSAAANVDPLRCKNNCRYCEALATRERHKKNIQKPKYRTKAYAADFRVSFAPNYTRNSIYLRRVDGSRSQKVYRNEWVQIPTAHDIFDHNVERICHAVMRLVNNGQKVIIHTKPRLSCVLYMITALYPYRKSIKFRLTITSTNNTTLALWEPGATSFEERIECLQLLSENGFKVGVSCTPVLDNTIANLYHTVKEYITDGFHIVGMSNPLGVVSTRSLFNAAKHVKDNTLNWIKEFAYTVGFQKDINFEPDVRKLLKIDANTTNYQVFCRLNQLVKEETRTNC